MKGTVVIRAISAAYSLCAVVQRIIRTELKKIKGGQLRRFFIVVDITSHR